MLPRQCNLASPIPPAEFLDPEVQEIETEAIAHCPLCSGLSFHPWAEGFDYELVTCRNLWRFVQCDVCDHVWLNPRPSISALARIYPPQYYAYNYEEQINSIARHGKEVLDWLKMRSILRLLNDTPKSYLDVGCGNGRFLKAMAKSGVPRSRLFGLELNHNVVQRLAGEGFQVFCKRVEECDDIPAEGVDLVTMFHVIEHVEDPAAVVKKITSWLRPGGVLALETPNLDSLDARHFKPGFWGGYHFPRHWNLFTPETLNKLLTMQGLDVIGTTFQTGHSFWMYSIHHQLKYGTRPHPALGRQFDPLKKLLPLMLFTGFDKIRASLGFRTSAMLMFARKPL